MNWGHKLTIVFAAFAVLIGTLVYKCTQQKFDLVSEDYYTQELIYQDKIDGSRAAAEIAPVTITQTASSVIIQMPEELRGLSVKGDVWLYCAYNASKDVKIPLNLNADGIMEINKHQITGSNYTAKITWGSGGTGYYKEIPLVITR